MVGVPVSHPLAQETTAVVLTRAGKEATVACKTHLAAQMALAWLGTLLVGDDLENAHDELASVVPVVRTYLEAWRAALPGAPAYREFVEHWTNQAYASWVDRLEAAANRVLACGGDAERDAFRWIARYERDFWQMAYSGDDV